MLRARTTSRIGIIALFLCSTLTTVAVAQKDVREKGFYLGLRLAGSGLKVDDDGTSGFTVSEDGGGLQLFTGYSFNRVFSLQLEFAGATHETSDPAIEVRPGSVALFAHYRFRPGHGFRPFVKGGLAGYGLVFDGNLGEVRLSGGGVPLGGGVDYFFNRRISLGLDLTYNIISWDKAVVDLGDTTMGFDIDEDGAQTSLGLAFGVYF